MDKPFIVCLNSLDIRTSGKIDVDNAIWGTVAFSWSTNPESKDEKWIRQLDGVFCDKKGVRLKILQVFSFLKYALIIFLLPIIGYMNILFREQNGFR